MGARKDRQQPQQTTPTPVVHRPVGPGANPVPVLNTWNPPAAPGMAPGGQPIPTSFAPGSPPPPMPAQFMQWLAAMSQPPAAQPAPVPAAAPAPAPPVQSSTAPPAAAPVPAPVPPIVQLMHSLATMSRGNPSAPLAPANPASAGNPFVSFGPYGGGFGTIAQAPMAGMPNFSPAVSINVPSTLSGGAMPVMPTVATAAGQMPQSSNSFEGWLSAAGANDAAMHSQMFDKYGYKAR